MKQVNIYNLVVNRILNGMEIIPDNIANELTVSINNNIINFNLKYHNSLYNDTVTVDFNDNFYFALFLSYTPEFKLIHRELFQQYDLIHNDIKIVYCFYDKDLEQLFIINYTPNINKQNILDKKNCSFIVQEKFLDMKRIYTYDIIKSFSSDNILNAFLKFNTKLNLITKQADYGHTLSYLEVQVDALCNIVKLLSDKLNLEDNEFNNILEASINNSVFNIKSLESALDEINVNKHNFRELQKNFYKVRDENKL